MDELITALERAERVIARLYQERNMAVLELQRIAAFLQNEAYHDEALAIKRTLQNIGEFDAPMPNKWLGDDY